VVETHVQEDMYRVVLTVFGISLVRSRTHVVEIHSLYRKICTIVQGGADSFGIGLVRPHT
jgi:hypothetical protein